MQRTDSQCVRWPSILRFSLFFIAAQLLSCATANRGVLTSRIPTGTDVETESLTAPILFYDWNELKSGFTQSRPTAQRSFASDLVNDGPISQETVMGRLLAIVKLVDQILVEIPPSANPSYYLAYHFRDEIRMVIARLQELSVNNIEVMKDLKLIAWAPAEITKQFGPVDQEILYVLELEKVTSNLFQESKRLKIYKPLSRVADSQIRRVQNLLENMRKVYQPGKILNYNSGLNQTASRLAEIRMIERCLRVLYNQGVDYFVSWKRQQGSNLGTLDSEALNLKSQLYQIIVTAREAQIGALRGSNQSTQLNSRIAKSPWNSYRFFENPDVIDLGDIGGTEQALERVHLVQYSYLAINYLISESDN